MSTFGAVGIVGVAVIIYLFIIFFALAIAAACYIFQALGLYTIAKRRGIDKPWLAFVPVGNSYILGAISDDYQFKVKGTVKNRRKLMLWLNVATLAMTIPVTVVSFIISLANVTGGAIQNETAFILLTLALLAINLLSMAVGIILTVISYFAYYDLFLSCTPSNALIFLILGIFVNSALPFILFFLRNKDEGMPTVNSNFEPTV